MSFVGRYVQNPRFSPDTLPGLALWLDAADATTVTLSGSNVTQWRDKSGNGRNAVPGNSPIYTSNQSVQFNGTTNYLTIQNASGMLANTYFTLFFVERLASFNGTYLGNHFFGDDTNSSVAGSGLHIGYIGQGYNWFRFAYINDGVDTTGLAQTGVLRMWACCLNSYRNRASFLNGALSATGSNKNYLPAYTSPVIGRAFGADGFSAYYNGQIYEIIAFTSDMTDSQRQQVEG